MIYYALKHQLLDFIANNLLLEWFSPSVKPSNEKRFEMGKFASEHSIRAAVLKYAVPSDALLSHREFYQTIMAMDTTAGIIIIFIIICRYYWFHVECLNTALALIIMGQTMPVCLLP